LAETGAVQRIVRAESRCAVLQGSVTRRLDA
jgi:hypothetical protein